MGNIDTHARARARARGVCGVIAWIVVVLAYTL